MQNRLAEEPSPYLKSAGHQPVHWYAWSDEAFEKAREADRPILLDIGAVWCHWCHVIDRESYENPEIAELINENFVAIKVDRDERPDIDARYQIAVSAVTGQGGWPLTAFLTPEGNLFYGGTYFPPENRHGMAGFKTLLPRIASIYKERRGDVHEDASKLFAALKQSSENQKPSETLPPDLADGVAATLLSNFDEEYGGFGEAPKFPHTGAIELALNRFFSGAQPELLELITRTLSFMAKGGIHDQLAGGFHRYSTDRRWIVPHFEKMSHDNAELLKNYTHAWQVTGNPLYRETAFGIVRFVREVLADAQNGGFFASQDADINLEDDGDYFTWTRDEAAKILSSEESRLINAYYDLGETGEMHHNPAKNVLFVAVEPSVLARDLNLTEEDFIRTLNEAKRKLLEARLKRPAPYIDQTLYLNWNGLMIQAFLEFSMAFDDRPAAEFALKTLDLVWTRAFDESRGFYHAFAQGKPRVPGFLDDQIQMAAAFLSACEATGENKYLEAAVKIIRLALDKFWDAQSGGFFDVEEPRDVRGKLSIRHKSIQDSPTPSPNAVAALVLDKLAVLTGDVSYAERAEATLKAFAPQAAHLGFFAATYAVALDQHLKGPLKILITGRDPASIEPLRSAAVKTYHPRKVVQIFRGEGSAAIRDEAILVMMETAKEIPGAKAYVCEGQSCRPPVTEAAALTQLITARSAS